MYILGDIGNSEIKIFYVNTKNEIVKKINLSTQNLNYQNLNKNFKF